MVTQLREIELEDIYNDPNKFGAPTFEEFARNSEKYLGRDEDTLASISDGPTMRGLRNTMSKCVYEIEGYRCNSLEEVQHVAECQGIPIRSLDYRVSIIPESSYKGKFLVKIAPKSELMRRRRWT